MTAAPPNCSQACLVYAPPPLMSFMFSVYDVHNTVVYIYINLFFLSPPTAPNVILSGAQRSRTA